MSINSQEAYEGTGTTLLRNQPVTYQKRDGLAFFQGDIVIGELDTIESAEGLIRHSSRENGLHAAPIVGKQYIWIDNIVPYQFGPNVPEAMKVTVLDAMDHWQTHTHFRFVERITDNADAYPDYLLIISQTFGCWSYVGRQGGEQKLNVVPGCGFGSTVYELGHAIGLWHEHTRKDRDHYIRINWANVRDSAKPNFETYSVGVDAGEYDYDSIMHYGAYDFSKNQQPTISTPDGIDIGQRYGLSEQDIEDVLANYPAYRPVSRIDNAVYASLMGSPVTVTAEVAFDPNGDALLYHWDFGDGTHSDTQNDHVSHRYADRGSYTVTLTVTDPDGNRSRENASATVRVYGFEVMVPVLALLL